MSIRLEDMALLRCLGDKEIVKNQNRNGAGAHGGGRGGGDIR